MYDTTRLSRGQDASRWTAISSASVGANGAFPPHAFFERLSSSTNSMQDPPFRPRGISNLPQATQVSAICALLFSAALATALFSFSH